MKLIIVTPACTAIGICLLSEGIEGIPFSMDFILSSHPPWVSSVLCSRDPRRYSLGKLWHTGRRHTLLEHQIMFVSPDSSYDEVKGYYSPHPWEMGNHVGWLLKIITFAFFPLRSLP